MIEKPLFVAGEAVMPNQDLVVLDAWSGEPYARVPLADRSAIDRAIDAASKTPPRLRPFERREVLAHAAARFAEKREALALTVAIEAGKPLRDARIEVDRLVDVFATAAEEATRIDGEALDLANRPRSAGTRGFTKRVPIGAVSLVTPFNFPLSLVAHKVAPAIAAGCSFVLKPSEKTPLSALAIGEVLAETALPRASWSIVVTRVEDAAPFVEDPRLALLSFTGSSDVGWKLRARAGKKRVVLELGGNAACIVDERQSIDAILPKIVTGSFAQAGQSCISVQRLLVHTSLADELASKLARAASKLRLGDPKDPTTELGPMIDEAAAQRLERWLAHAVANGARVLAGGKRRGSTFEATVVENVAPGEPLREEEAFGPVVILERFERFDEALASVNASRYGLQAGVFTNDLAHAMQAWDELEVGGVVVGDVPTFRVDSAPYGGVKDSGVGREGVRSTIGDMTEERLLVLRS